MAKKTVKEDLKLDNTKEVINYIDDSVEIIPVSHLGKHVELCARNAYKSENKITDTSWTGMIRGLKKNGHSSCFEHAPVYLEITPNNIEMKHTMIINALRASNYVRQEFHLGKIRLYTNGRVILEHADQWLDSILDGSFSLPGISLFTPASNDPNRRISVRITTSRVIMDSILRHRIFSPTAESTRYVDYLGKFTVSNWSAHETTNEQDEELKAAFEDCKKHYDKLKELGAHKDVCRLVLALGIKSELIFTGYANDFLGNFYQLRIDSTADKTVQKIAYNIHNLITN